MFLNEMVSSLSKSSRYIVGIRTSALNARASTAVAKSFQRKSKVYPTSATAIADIPSGCSVFVGGFGPCGLPMNLLMALKDTNVKDLHMISNNTGE